MHSRLLSDVTHLILKCASHSAWCCPHRGGLVIGLKLCCIRVVRNTEYGKWLIGKKDRFNDQLEQWNRIVGINPPTVDPYIFYGNMMVGLEDRADKAKFALSAQGLRTVSRAMAKGAQRASIQDPMKTEIMTKNAADASRQVAEHLASASMLLASFPLPGEPESAVQKGLFELAKLWDESNIVPGVAEEDLYADEATKTAAVRHAVKEAMHMLKVSKKPLPCVPVPPTTRGMTQAAPSRCTATRSRLLNWCTHSQI